VDDFVYHFDYDSNVWCPHTASQPATLPCQFKAWCNGDKSNIENSTDHFFEDTRQNALAALIQNIYLMWDRP